MAILHDEDFSLEIEIIGAGGRESPRLDKHNAYAHIAIRQNKNLHLYG